MSDGNMTYEDWLRGCVHHDGRHGYATLPCDEVLKIADFIERLRVDRKTENCSEIPNNCDTCRNKGFEGCEQPCLGCGCCGLYEPKDEPKSYTTWANTEPKQGTDCTQVDWKDRMWAEAVKDEPQTERSE